MASKTHIDGLRASVKRFVVSYSGGVGSFCAAKRIIAAHGPEAVTLLFCDTKTEDEDLYRFLGESTEVLGVELVTHVDGRDIWGVFNDVRFMGNSRIDPCSRVLKREPFHKWMNKNRSPDDTALVVGISWDEVHRLKRMKAAWDPFEVLAPMTEKPYLSKSAMLDEVRDAGLRPPRLYALGFPHNNCGGFCIKTGQAQFKLLYEQFPERYLEHERRQEELFAKIGQRGFIRRVVNGTTQHLSLKQFREILEATADNDEQLRFDWGGCGCFTDD